MIVLIYGGSGSGKSAYAEDYVCKLKAKNKFYLATMAAFDEESKSRIARHRELRSGKGFVTLEHSSDVCNAIFEIDEVDEGEFSTDPLAPQKPTILLECMSNLVANEMFRDGKINPEKYCVDKILKDVDELEKAASTLVIVSNNIFEDGVSYDSGTKEYLRALGSINNKIAARATEVYEVVVGIGIKIKE